MCRDRSARVAGFVCGVLAFAAVSARAQTVVTTCGRDDAPGGVNLATALAAGGSVVIRCDAPPQTIQITQTHVLSPGTAIDGTGSVALVGDGSRPLFTTSSSLALSNLTVRNPRASGVPVDSQTTNTAIVVGGRVDLVKVRTENTIGPYIVDALTATDSVFEANGDADGESYRAIIEAETIELRRVTFNKNLDHPIAGGAGQATGRAVASRKISIEDSTFSENRLPILAQDASVVVRRTSFAGNGTKPSAAGRAWGCCAGALSLVHSIAAVEDSTFVGNGSAGFGGAISAIASRLSIARSLFEQNSARIGGAVMFWGKAARTNVWSTGSLPGPLSLTLNRVRFRTNTATELGGAVAWSGEMGGDSALFANNSARHGGGLAHWSLSGSLDADFADVFPTLVGQTQPGPETLALSRGVFLDNTAVEQGAAFASGDATVRLGNLLAVRNTVTKASASASALHGADITLINATVVDNGSTGVALAAPLRALALINSIVAGNAGGNCVAPANKLTLNAANIQYPGNTCGSAASRAPALDKDYAPSLLSPARVGGEMSRCLGPLVGGRDLHGASRGSTGACSIGAIEPDLQRDLFKNTPLERGGARWWWFLLWLLIILILLLGIVIGRKRARARRRAKAR